MLNPKRALSYNERERILAESGRHGRAEVVKARVTGTVWDGMVSVEEWGTFRFLLRVTPEGDAPFEVRLHMRLPGNVDGSPGTTFPVLFDPNDHGFMIVDPSIVPRTKEELLTAKIYAAPLSDTPAAFTAGALKGRGDVDQSAASPTQFSSSVQMQLDQLEQLKAANLIDDSHYEAKKQKLTGR
jgi:hypothetical protein